MCQDFLDSVALCLVLLKHVLEQVDAAGADGFPVGAFIGNLEIEQLLLPLLRIEIGSEWKMRHK